MQNYAYLHTWHMPAIQYVLHCTQWQAEAYTPIRNKLLCQRFMALRALGINGFQLKRRFSTHGKSKSWGPFLSYHINSTANSAHLAYVLGNRAGLAQLFSWQQQNGPRILIFSIAMVAKPSFQLKSIAIWAPAFFMDNNSVIAPAYTQAQVLQARQNSKGCAL